MLQGGFLPTNHSPKWPLPGSFQLRQHYGRAHGCLEHEGMRFLQMKSLPPPQKKKETRANAQMFETKDYELVLKYEKKTHQESKSNRYD